MEVGLEMLQIQAVSELDLATEASSVALAEVWLVVLLGLPVAFCSDGQHVALDSDVEVLCLHSG